MDDKTGRDYYQISCLQKVSHLKQYFGQKI
jgi:hypothetical protein